MQIARDIDGDCGLSRPGIGVLFRATESRAHRDGDGIRLGAPGGDCHGDDSGESNDRDVHGVRDIRNVVRRDRSQDHERVSGQRKPRPDTDGDHAESGVAVRFRNDRGDGARDALRSGRIHRQHVYARVHLG